MASRTQQQQAKNTHRHVEPTTPTHIGPHLRLHQTPPPPQSAASERCSRGNLTACPAIAPEKSSAGVEVRRLRHSLSPLCLQPKSEPRPPCLPVPAALPTPAAPTITGKHTCKATPTPRDVGIPQPRDRQAIRRSSRRRSCAASPTRKPPVCSPDTPRCAYCSQIS